MDNEREKLVEETINKFNQLLLCDNPVGNSHEAENDFFESLEIVKAKLRENYSREYNDFSVTLMHNIAKVPLSNRNYYAWIAELELKTQAALLS